MRFGNIEVRFSMRNGLIIVRKSGGRAEVIAFGSKQTSVRYGELWADALSHCPTPPPGERRVLMLGLAGGGALSAIYEKYNTCSITAIEYDMEMVKIARALQLQAPRPFPEVIEGDAGEELVRLKRRFDLIVVDIFRGIVPSPLIAEDNFLHALKEHLKPWGVVVINTVNAEMYLEAARHAFAHSHTHTNGGNVFGIFSESALLDSNQGPSP